MTTLYDIDLMREALEKVEWEDNNGMHMLYCPWGREFYYYITSADNFRKDALKHKPDCLRQRALGLDKKDGQGA